MKLIVANPLRQNKLLSAPEAVELGFADRLLEPVEFVDESLAYAVELVEAGGIERAEPDWSELDTILRKARSRVDDAVHGATRAPYVALELIAGRAGADGRAGLRRRGGGDGRAARQPAGAGVRLRVHRRRAADEEGRRPARRGAAQGAEGRHRRRRPDGDAARDAVRCAGSRCRSCCATSSRQASTTALATIREEVGARKPFLATLVDGGTGWEQFAGCDLVLEAVFEELDVKREVFARGARRRAGRDPRHEHVVALRRGDGRRRRASLLQPGRRAAARRDRAHAADDRRAARDRVGRRQEAAQARRARRATRRRSSSTACSRA